MAVVINKSERKQLIKTEVVGTCVVFFEAATGGEVGRVDVADVMSGEQNFRVAMYGIKQIIGDVVATLAGQAKLDGVQAACDALTLGQWPRRPAAEATMEPALAALMRMQGCSRAEARAMLGMTPE